MVTDLYSPTSSGTMCKKPLPSQSTSPSPRCRRAGYVPSLQPIERLRFYRRHAEKQQRVSLFISFYNQYSSHDPSRSVSVQLVLSPCCHTHRDRMRQNATHVSRFWCHRFNHNQPRLFLLPSSFAFGASTLVQHPPSGVLSLEIGPLLGGNIGGR